MKVTVLGGGTLGALITFFIENNIKNVTLTNVHSPSKGIIGVGEGTTGGLQHYFSSYQPLGTKRLINEREFFRETKANIKLTIKYEDWCKKDYWSAFEPNMMEEEDLSVYDYSFINHNEACYLNKNTHFCKSNKTGLIKNVSLNDQWSNHYGYHYDGNLISKYFLKKCKKTNFIYDDVIDVEYKDNGFVKTLITKLGQKIETDFVIDCSGFHRVFKEKYKLYTKKVTSSLINRAMPFLVQYKDNEELIAYTIAKGMQYGWMWKAPIQSRYGMGYCYNRDLISDEDVIKEVETLLGHEIEPVKFIDWEPQITEQIWHKNIALFGLSSNFIEPLEATNIHGALVSFLSFFNHTIVTSDAEHHWTDNLYNERVQNKFNKEIVQLYENFESFIQLHYLNPKYKTEFWNWYADKSNWTETNKYLIEKGNNGDLIPQDFYEGQSGVAGPCLVYPTLLDMELIPPRTRGVCFDEHFPEKAYWQVNHIDNLCKRSYTVREFSQAINN
tara:strand:- start:534 stop:2030 length:1497 start_codon:yes stop_codon:yes gene_type:complete